MNTTLAGYRLLETIFEDINTIIYRGIKEVEETPVIIKTLKTEYPTLEQLAQLKHEYKILQALGDLEGIIKPLGLENYKNNSLLILSDFKGKSLKQILVTQKFQINHFFAIAIQLAETLSKFHQKKIIHKDIKPHNIVLHPETGEVKIIDFSISSQFSRENQTISSPHLLKGTFAYMSPEQTGRMNRSIDYRTDFYSLGVTFYEMLTGTLPFKANDPLEFVHCHIAKQPVPPHKINSQIPQSLSEVVMKLLAKTAEERYQSATGLKADLEICLKMLSDPGKISHFTVGQLDLCSQFCIPQKLYGREEEVASLLNAFHRVSIGATELMLISGYSGIGKTSIVNEVHKPIVKARGYFISGKFDQFQRNIPYSAAVKAFQFLVKQLLTESEIQLKGWKEKLLDALGANGQVIIDVIPEVELIISKQPPVQELGATEAQNRFNLVFQKFIRVFCSVEHPLVIFLDDLQWADSATLKLLQVMMTDEETKYLFLMGAYRDNEVNPTHPLMMTLDKLQKQGAKIDQITLTPLLLQQIGHLIADTAHKDRESVMSLAELVMGKTQGNPFFINQFLKTLYQENLLYFNFQQKAWDWNISEIEALGITDNVVELMLGKLKKLPESTQQVLRLAACVGNSFDLNTLSIINEKSPEETFEELLPAMQDGLILANSDLGVTEEGIVHSHPVITTYTFLHDRVQQSAYALIDSNLQTAVHLKIGRLLLLKISPERRAERIFEIADHLNLGRQLIADHQEKVELALLNLTAARKAKDATAYAAARTYLKIGLEILPSDIWQDSYEIAFPLHKELADIEYLNGNFEKSESLIKIAFSQAKSDIEKAEIYNSIIVQYTLLTKYEEAIKAGLKALRLLGVELAEENLTEAVRVEMAEAKANLANKKIASLIDAEKMKEPAKKMALKLLGNMGPLTFFSSQELWKLTVIKAINLSLQYGFVEGGSYCYSCYGIILNSILGDYQSAYEFGRLALSLSENSNNLSQNCQDSVIFANYLNCWVKPIKTTVEINSDGYTIGLQSGNLQWTGYNRMFQTITYFFQGMNLNSLLEDISKSLHFCRQTKNLWAIDIIAANKFAILNLMGQEDEISEKEHIENFQERKSMAALCEFFVLKAQALYLYGQYSEALKASEHASELIDYLMGHISSAHHNFYRSLILTALYPAAEASQQNNYWEQLEANQKQIKIWADNCPENFGHKFWLVAAEMARISGRDLEAMDLYDRVIASARENNFIQNEALSNELAAKFWLAKGKDEFAQFYLTKAYYNYQVWGAKRKVEKLEKKYPQLMALTSNQTANQTKASQTIDTTNTTSSHLGNTLDLATVMKAAQAISGEIVLDTLIDQLMKISMENAGATKGILMLDKEGSMAITATATVHQDEFVVQQSPQTEISVTVTHFYPASIINYVTRIQNNIVLKDAYSEGLFTDDPYVVQTQPKSILCTPLIHQGKLIGLLYLENHLTSAAFTPERVEVLKLLSSQMAIALENALLIANLATAKEQLEEYSRTLEVKVEERTRQLQAKEASLAEAQRLAHLGNWELDVNTLEIIWSDELLRIFGFDPKQPAPSVEAVEKLIHPDDYQFWKTTTDRVVALGEDYDMEFRILAPDGSVRYISAKGKATINAEGKVVRMFGTSLDITERKLAEKALQEREVQLIEQATKLEQALHELKQTQANLIQTEKMSSLGQMVAGIAHEINNPVNFIYGNLNYTDEYIQKLLRLIQVYAQAYPNPVAKVQATIEEIELDFLIEDLDALLASMKAGAERIRSIVLSLRIFSRLDEAAMKEVDIHSGIDSALLILQSRLNATQDKAAIQVVKNYSVLPLVECFAGDLNQVFMNVLSNAIDALEMSYENEGIKNYSILMPAIHIETEVMNGDTVAIRIKDNGPGMSLEVQPQIFDPFFTTKPVGKGNGLGLSISYQIVVEKHGGHIECFSTSKAGTEFMITIPIKR